VHKAVSISAGKSVSFDSDQVSVPGRLTYASPDQINVQIPWELAGHSSARMKVTTGDFATAVYTLPLANYAPAVFEDSGFVVAQEADTYEVISTSYPAKKDSWIILYANGLGPVDNTPPTGEGTPMPDTGGLATCLNKPEVTVDGKPAEVYFAGLVPTGIGYYQINVKVPADAQSGVRPVTVTVNGVTAKTVNLPIQ
jgi:uncharacterized protein (TIGR03437 family)